MLQRASAALANFDQIFWVIGGAASGKSTICRTIAEQTGIPVYDMDAHIYGAYMGRYDKGRHPASLAWFTAVNSLAFILSLSPTEFDSLNRAANVEYLDLLAEEMAQNRPQGPLLVDGGLTHPSVLAQVLPLERIVCLVVDTAVSHHAWNHDPERAEMKQSILNLPDGAVAWNKFLTFDQQINDTMITESRVAGITICERTAMTSVESLANTVLKHFRTTQKIKFFIMDANLYELHEKLDFAYINFVQVAHQLDPIKRYQAGVCGEWSPKDVVSHLIGWDKSLKGFIVDIENFDPPYDIHKFNMVSVKSREHLSWDEVMDELETNIQELAQAIATVEPQMKIYDRVQEWLLGRTKDYELHKNQLEDWLRN